MTLNLPFMISILRSQLIKQMFPAFPNSFEIETLIDQFIQYSKDDNISATNFFLLHGSFYMLAHTFHLCLCRIVDSGFYLADNRKNTNTDIPTFFILIDFLGIHQKLVGAFLVFH